MIGRAEAQDVEVSYALNGGEPRSVIQPIKDDLFWGEVHEFDNE